MARVGLYLGVAMVVVAGGAVMVGRLVRRDRPIRLGLVFALDAQREKAPLWWRARPEVSSPAGSDRGTAPMAAQADARALWSGAAAAAAPEGIACRITLVGYVDRALIKMRPSDDAADMSLRVYLARPPGQGGLGAADVAGDGPGDQNEAYFAFAAPPLEKGDPLHLVVTDRDTTGESFIDRLDARLDASPRFTQAGSGTATFDCRPYDGTARAPLLASRVALADAALKAEDDMAFPNARALFSTEALRLLENARAAIADAAALAGWAEPEIVTLVARGESAARRLRARADDRIRASAPTTVTLGDLVITASRTGEDSIELRYQNHGAGPIKATIEQVIVALNADFETVHLEGDRAEREHVLAPSEASPVHYTVLASGGARRRLDRGAALHIHWLDASAGPGASLRGPDEVGDAPPLREIRAAELTFRADP